MNLFVKEILGKGEDANELEQLLKEIEEQIIPKSNLEKHFVNLLVADLWQIKRIIRLKKEIHECQLDLMPNYKGLYYLVREEEDLRNHIMQLEKRLEKNT